MQLCFIRHCHIEIAGVAFGPPKKEKGPKVVEVKNEEKERLKAEKKAAKKAKAAAHKETEKGEAAPATPAANAPAPVSASTGKTEETAECKENYGDYGLINSSKWIERSFTSIGALDKSKVGNAVWIRARMHNSRAQGSGMVFVVLRETQFTAQALLIANVTEGVSKDMLKYAASLPRETIVDIKATVVASPTEIKGCSQKEVELKVNKIFAVSKSLPILPLQIDDASRPERADGEPDDGLVRVNPDTRLDNRVLDLRTTAKHAIFRLQAGVCKLFRQHLTNEGSFFKPF